MENLPQKQNSAISDKDLIGYLDNLGLTARLNEGEKNTYLQIAKAFGLNPFKREIHVSKYGEQMSIITGYEVYIKRAERSGQLDGWSAVTTGSVAKGDLKATITIYRKDRSHPFIWEAIYNECVQKTKEGNVTKFWQKAEFMTKKVGISQAFRLCFSDELGGMPYTADELPDLTEDAKHEVVDTKKIGDIPCLTEDRFLAIIDLCNSVHTIDELKELFKSFTESEQNHNDIKKIVNERKKDLLNGATK